MNSPLDILQVRVEFFQLSIKLKVHETNVVIHCHYKFRLQQLQLGKQLIHLERRGGSGIL